MTPMEAWRIISKNLTELYQRRYAAAGHKKPWTQEEITAEVLCFKALETAEKLTDMDEAHFNDLIKRLNGFSKK